jgi:tetratricopeptide (TPR) repeat protein
MTRCRVCDDQLMGHVAGELSPEAARSFEHHLEASEACAREAAKAWAVLRLATALPDPAPPPELVARLRLEAARAARARPAEPEPSRLTRFARALVQRIGPRLWAPALFAALVVIVVVRYAPELGHDPRLMDSEAPRRARRTEAAGSADRAVREQADAGVEEKLQAAGEPSEREEPRELGRLDERQAPVPATPPGPIELSIEMDAEPQARADGAAAKPSASAQSAPALEGQLASAATGEAPDTDAAPGAAGVVAPADRAKVEGGAGQVDFVANEPRASSRLEPARLPPEPAAERRFDQSAFAESPQAQPAGAAASADSLLSEARAARARGELERAIEFYRRAAAPDFPLAQRAQALLELGELHAEQGQKELARAAYREAAELGTELAEEAGRRARTLP